MVGVVGAGVGRGAVNQEEIPTSGAGYEHGIERL